MKIAVVGYSGSGKSTFARRCGDALTCPVAHLDAIHWLPQWRERPRAEELAWMQSFLAENGSWIIEGNYGYLEYSRRLEQADAIVFFDFPRLVCLMQVWKRYRLYRGNTRPDMGTGCNEKLDWAFVKWVLRDGRSRSKRRNYRDTSKTYADKFYTVRTHAQADKVFHCLTRKN